jgi:hypothetical protein
MTDWVFAGVLLLGMWELATILDAGQARSRRHSGSDRAAAPPDPDRLIAGGRALGTW